MCIRDRRKRFGFNGWADALSMESFSIGALEAPQARLWIGMADGKRGYLMTAVPDKWYSSGERKKLRAQFLKELPEGFDPNARWLEWEFDLPGERKAMLDTAEAISAAIHKVLVPNAPQT